ncbi:hypothetical protein AB3K30_21335 [Bacillus subtilis]
MSRKQQLQACWTGWREMVLSAAGIELTTEGKARLEQFLPGHFSKKYPLSWKTTATRKKTCS